MNIFGRQTGAPVDIWQQLRPVISDIAQQHLQRFIRDDDILDPLPTTAFTQRHEHVAKTADLPVMHGQRAGLVYSAARIEKYSHERYIL